MRLSAVVLAKNEEKNIQRALNSLSFCSETIVVDDFSADKTVNLSEKAGARIFKRRLKGDFSSQRNFGLRKSRGDWVLFLDADEVVSPELAVEINKVINRKSEKGAYYIKRRDYWWGRELKHGEVSKVRNKGLVRLVRRSSGKWVSPVHESFQTLFQEGFLGEYIDHFPHQSVTDFLREINNYTTLRAKELHRQGEKVSPLEIIFFPFGKFLSTYFLKLGFLDGAAGFTYCLLMSFHSFLVRAKLYQYQNID